MKISGNMILTYSFFRFINADLFNKQQVLFYKKHSLDVFNLLIYNLLRIPFSL